MPKAFPLDTVKRVRELRERQEQREFARRRRELALIDLKIDDLGKLKEQVVAQVNRMRHGVFDPRTDLLYVRYLSRLDAQKSFLRLDRRKAEERLEEQRLAMFEARKLRKTMDVLKEHFDEEVRMEESREETKRLAEVAVQRFGRQRDSE